MMLTTYPPAIGGKHLTASQESANGTHLGKPGLCIPWDKIGQAHLYNWQPAQANSDSWGIIRKHIITSRLIIQEIIFGGEKVLY